MNKKLFSGFLSAVVLGGLVSTASVWANEGTVLMKGDGVSGACFATSVYVDGTYRVLATCRDLKSALSPEQNRYVVWLTQEDGKPRRLGEIENGKLATATDVKFTDLFVTAESDSYGNKPSENVLLSGKIQPINFGSGVANTEITSTPTPTPKKNVTAEPTETAGEEAVVEEKAASKGIAGALSTVLKIALFGFGTLILVVGVFSFISRKRSL